MRRLEDTLLIIDSIEAPIVLVGSSMGGWLATVAASRRREKIKGLLLIASAPDFIQELVEPRLSKSDSWDLQQDQIVSLPNEYDNPYPITQKLIESAYRISLFQPSMPMNDANNLPGRDAKSIPEQLTCPIRMIHGTTDNDVPYELSIRLMKEFKNAQAQITLLNQADHRLSDELSLACIVHELLMLVEQVNVARYS